MTDARNPAEPSDRDRVARVLAQIRTLPEAGARGGPLSGAALERLAELAVRRAVRASAETGSGASTLLLSHLAERHLVFSLGPIEPLQSSPLLKADAVQFVLGPTQTTLPGFRFEAPLDLVLLDGPHAYPFPELEYYYLYPRLSTGGLLVVDDIDIPSIHQLFCFLREDAMFRLDSVVGRTAFFVRTAAPTFCGVGDGWEGQAYNLSRYPFDLDSQGNKRPPLLRAFSGMLPGPLRRLTRGWPSRWLRRLGGSGS